MSYTMLWGSLATVIGAIDYFIYAASAMKKDGSRPSRMTWFILTAMSWITAWSYFELGASATLGAALTTAIGSTAIALLSLKYGHGGWQTIDKLTLAAVIVTVLVWWYTGSAFVALVCSLAVDFLALVPTLVKLVRWPGMEEFLPWFVTIISNAFNILALDVTRIGEWTVELALYPFYMFAMNSLVVLAIMLPWFGWRGEAKRMRS